MLQSGRTTRPQSWNRYAYVLNNPLKLIDPTGLIDEDPQAKKKKEGQQQQQKEVIPKEGYYIEYKEGKQQTVNNQKVLAPNGSEFQGADEKPLGNTNGTFAVGTVVVYKDGKPVDPQSGVTITETVTNEKVTITNDVNGKPINNGKPVDAPQSLKDQIQSANAGGKDLPLLTGGQRYDLQGLAFGSQKDVNTAKTIGLTSVDKVVFTVKDANGAVVAERAIRATQTATKVTIVKGPVLR